MKQLTTICHVELGNDQRIVVTHNQQSFAVVARKGRLGLYAMHVLDPKHNEIVEVTGD